MEELELSIMSHGPDPAGDLQPLLDQFTAQYRYRVHVTVLPWETAWAELVKMALYHTGPDVSEIGSNWVSNLMAMNALHPFHPTELAVIGAPASFLATAWQTGSVVGDKNQWAIPWLADTRVIYYRRDLAEKAGLDERTAFQTQLQLEQTLARLQSSGVAAPWVVPTQRTPNTLHNVASWIWGAGGDFISADGKRTLFAQPQSRAGIRAYLGLHRYLPPAPHQLDARQSDGLYLQGQAAVTISGPWLVLPNLEGTPFSQVIANTGLALPPGVPFVGGSNLVVWEHSRRQRAAIELVHFLTSQLVQTNYCPRAGLLSVRLDVLDAAPFATHPIYQVMIQGLKAGRSFPALPLWGLVEDVLIAALTRLWEKVLVDGQLDLEAAIAEHLGTLAHRLDLTLLRHSQGIS